MTSGVIKVRNVVFQIKLFQWAAIVAAPIAVDSPVVTVQFIDGTRFGIEAKDVDDAEAILTELHAALVEANRPHGWSPEGGSWKDSKSPVSGE